MSEKGSRYQEWRDKLLDHKLLAALTLFATGVIGLAAFVASVGSLGTLMRTLFSDEVQGEEIEDGGGLRDPVSSTGAGPKNKQYPGGDNGSVHSVHAPNFEFALDMFSVDGNIFGAGNSDGNIEFSDSFDDGLFGEFPTSAFGFSQGTERTTESGGLLHLGTSDGTFVREQHGYSQALDDLMTPPWFHNGAGSFQVSANFRPDYPAFGQTYSLGLVSGEGSAQESAVIFVSNNGARVTVNAGDEEQTFASVPISLTDAGCVCLRITVNEQRHVTFMYSLDGSGYDTIWESRSGIFNAGDNAFAFVQASEVK